MSAVFIITPVIAPLLAAAWPALAAAVGGAAAALGFSEMCRVDKKAELGARESVEIEMKNNDVIGEIMDHEQAVSFVRDDITLTFRKDARGRCGIHVAGEGHSKEELRSIGRDFSRRIIQDYVKRKVVEELKRKGFTLSQEETTAEQSIRLTVRKWRS